jgi:hypothetical protein
LAEDQHERAIGVPLSGTATDGTLGLEAIKAEGEITFAQDGKKAKCDSMPQSAIAAGCVDFELSPEKTVTGWTSRTEADKTRMFQRYSRLSARPTAGEPSAGLGLSIVNKLVEAMDGVLTCESTAGSSAKFTVRLPKAPQL